MSFFVAWFVAFYVVPFLLIAAMPGWRSFGIAALIGMVALVMLWTNYLRHRFDSGGNGFSSAMGELALHMLTAGVVASVIGRAIALKRRNCPGDPSSFVVLAGFFLFGPFLAIF